MRNKLILVLLSAFLCFLAASEKCWGHDISGFDVGTRITFWVCRSKIQLGLLVELKNFPAQDQRKDCDLNKDMQIDDKEREYYIKKCCKKFFDKVQLKINGEVVAKTVTKAEVWGVIGDVDRRPFSTYMEAEVPLDESLYRVKIEYTNNNFRNEEPDIINDVNISVSKELDNVNIYPITQIVQYLDRDVPDYLFMEMTLDRHFFIEFGYRDVGSAQEPFVANDIMLTKDSGQTSRTASAGTTAPGTSSLTWDRKLYKWLENFTMTRVEGAIKADDIITWLWLFVVGVFIGLVHVMLPGHGKGVVLSYVGATNARPLDAVKLSLMITVVHTVSTVVLVAFILTLAGRYLSGTVKNIGVTYLALLSGGLIVAIGVYLFFFFKPVKLRREEEKEREIVEKALEPDGAGRSSFSLKLKVAVATGIIPCVTSSAAAVLCFNYEEYLKAFLLIGFIAIGQAITLSLMGVAASGGMFLLSKGAAGKKKGLFVTLLKFMPKITAVILIVLGVWAFQLGWRWKTALSATVQPMTAEERIAAYEKVVEKKPGGFDAHFNLGLLYAAKDELEKTAGHFEKALTARPDDLDSARFMAHALARQEKYEDALERYDSALKLKPDDKNLLFNTAYVQEKLGRDKDAIERYRKAEAGHGHPKASFNLGLIYEKQSRLDEALKRYLKAAEGRPDDARIRMAIANTYRNKKEYLKAAQHLLMVHKKSPQSKEVNLSLANIYLCRLGQEEAARPFVDAYLRNGGREEIEAALAELEKQEIKAPNYLKWSPPDAAAKFEKFGACAVPFLTGPAGKQTGEQLKSTLAAIAATQAPQAMPCIISVLNDTRRWSQDELYDDYGAEFGTPPIPVVAKEAFIKCMSKSAVHVVVRELVRVMDEVNNREDFLKRLYYNKCVDYPVELMENVLEFAGTAEGADLRRAVDLALSLKNDPMAMSNDPETVRTVASYVTKWWQDNKDSLLWDKGNYYFYKKEEK